MTSNNFPRFIQNISTNPLRVLDVSIPSSKYIPIDLSFKNKDLLTLDVSSSIDWEKYINSYVLKNKAEVAFGGYLEQRNIYQRSAYFNNKNQEEERNIHIGVDLWAEANTKIYTPLNGIVHSFKNNTNHGDYGPTIILKHNEEGIEFFTLYGHLSVSSFQNLYVGQTFKAGNCIASLGDSSVNGDYAPHLHFQIIKDIEHFVGDYPGVCNKKELDKYKANCPDPNLLLKLSLA